MRCKARGRHRSYVHGFKRLRSESRCRFVTLVGIPNRCRLGETQSVPRGVWRLLLLAPHPARFRSATLVDADPSSANPVPIPCPILGIWSVTVWTISYEKDTLIWAD